MNYFKAIFKDLRWVILLTLAFLLAPRVIWWLDPTAAPLDAGYLTWLLLGALKVFASFLLLWGVVHLGFPTFWLYVHKEDPADQTDQTQEFSDFQQDWAALPPWGRVASLLFLVAVVLLVVCANLAA